MGKKKNIDVFKATKEQIKDIKFPPAAMLIGTGYIVTMTDKMGNEVVFTLRSPMYVYTGEVNTFTLKDIQNG